MKTVSRWVLLGGCTLSLLLPFIGKAFCIDDPLFIWMAEQISRHPSDPYGFQVNWMGAPEPMWSAMQNPPLCSVYIAVVGALFGWNELALHSAFLLWPVAAVIGTYRIARRFCSQPALAALLTLFTPVFLVSATNVMCDVMLLALYVWAVEFWLAGLERDQWWQLATSALLASAAMLTKYFGISVVGLLIVYTIRRNWRDWPLLPWLTIPCALTLAYDAWTTRKYGHPLFMGATHYANMISAKYAIPLPKRLLIGLGFTGGCMFAAIPFLVCCRRRSWLLLAGSFVIWLACFYLIMPRDENLAFNYPFAAVEEAVFATAGCAILVLAVLDFASSLRADALLLMSWTLGTCIFATFLNWSVTGRTILPLAPPAAILLMRHFGQLGFAKEKLLAGFSALVAIAVTAADFYAANTAREASAEFHERFGHLAGTVWFQSHWGFQYYMQGWGARPLNVSNSEISSEDVMIVPANNTGVVSIPPERVYRPEERVFPTLPLVTTVGMRTGAFFYSSLRGPLPWAIGAVPGELYYIARFR